MPKILIIRFSSIGDIVLTTPVIRIAKTQILGAEVHLVTKKNFLPVVAANPFLDKIHTVGNSLKETIAELKLEAFDVVIDLHNNLRSLRIKRALKAKQYSFNKLNIEKWQAVNFKQLNKLPDVHIVDRYLDTLSDFEVKNDHKGLDYFIPEDAHVESTRLPETHQSGYIGWVIGGSYFTKIFPKEKVVEAIRQIDRPFLLLGGPEDAESGDFIQQKCGKKVVNACGQFSLNESASLVQQADAVLSNDTGLMHIAAAFDKPILSFWGNTVPEFGMYPYMPKNGNDHVMLQVDDLRCRPCSKLGYKRCPKKHFYCMQLVDSDKIVDWINQLEV